MAFILLRLFYGIYFLGSAVILYHLVSTLLFDSKNPDQVWLYRVALLLFFWPLALFSEQGRQRLRELKEKL